MEVVRVGGGDGAASKRRSQRHRYISPSGQSFTLFDRDGRWWIDFQRAGLSRVREFVGVGHREAVAGPAGLRVDELVRRALEAHTPGLVRVAAEMLASAEWRAKRTGYTRQVKGHLINYILPALGHDTPVGAVGAEELRRFKRELGEGDLSLRTCNRILTTLRQLLKWAADPGGYAVTPPLPRNFPESVFEAADKWQRLSSEQIASVLGYLDEEVKPLFVYVANTGLRIGAALATEWAWVELKQGRVRYPASAMKGKRPHTVELNASAATALEELRERCPERPFPFSYWFALKRWVRAREAAGFPTLRIHDLRHSWVSAQLDAGTPVQVVRDMAAHRSLMVTQLYAHGSDEARRAAAARVSVTPDVTAVARCDKNVP